MRHLWPPRKTKIDKVEDVLRDMEHDYWQRQRDYIEPLLIAEFNRVRKTVCKKLDTICIGMGTWSLWDKHNNMLYDNEQYPKTMLYFVFLCDMANNAGVSDITVRQHGQE